MKKEKSITHVYSLDSSNHTAIPLAHAYVAAGFPSPADDYIEKNLDLNEYLINNPAATFFVKVSGDSMIDTGIHHGDILVVDRSLDADPGRVVIAVVDGEMLVKRLRIIQQRFVLMAENKDYPPVEITRSTDFSVWGVATYVIHPL
jgi:DNA polymerase V